MKITVYIDGVCNLCYGCGSFIVRHAPKGKFEFQDIATLPLNTTGSIDTVMVKTIEGQLLYRSEAVRYILGNMNGVFRLAGTILSLFPNRFRNYVYDWIARNRYKWFGKSDACRLPQA
ncbi:MAG: thiol-disulfide oxidoreductase DCC family protein [Bacteroidota bacterium]